MPNPPKPPIELLSSNEDIDPLTREALAWIAYLNSGEEKAEDWDSFETWKAASKAHEDAAAEAVRLWGELGPTLKRFSGTGPRKLTAIAAAAIGLSAVAFLSGAFGPPASFFAEYQSAIGEIRSVVLRDGSHVDLDTATSFDMSPDNRTLTLYSGQIYIHVQRDPARPFRVSAADGTIEALGTAFSVRRERDSAEVVVTESAVRVSRSISGKDEQERVAAGQSVTFNMAGIGKPMIADTKALTAWRRGELVFNERPLGEVVQEIERYKIGRILILGQELSSLPVTGQFNVRDTDTVLSAMHLSLPIRIVSVPGLTVIMRDADRKLPGH